jgi:hypothetical protein
MMTYIKRKAMQVKLFNESVTDTNIEDLRMVIMKSVIFFDMAAFSLVEVYQGSRRLIVSLFRAEE